MRSALWALFALATLVAACDGSAGTTAPAPSVLAPAPPVEGPCKPTTVVPYRFGDYTPPSSAPRPPFIGNRFAGLGNVVSIAGDGGSLVAELVVPSIFEVFAPTLVKITPQTSFDYTMNLSASIRAGGVPGGSTELFLAPGAPAIGAGQLLFIECAKDGAKDGFMTGQPARTAEAAPAGAPSWKLTAPLARSWPEGARAWYGAEVRIARLDELKLSVGQTVVIEFEGVPGDYHATKLTSAPPSYGYSY